MRYAQNTSVSVEKSEGEIKNLLIRYGASQYASAWSSDKALIRFKAQNRLIQFVLPLPDPKSPEFIYMTRKGVVRKDLGERTDEWAHELWEQACRQRWRALALAIKAKLEAVESGIATFEEEFYAHIVLPGGKTVFQMTKENVELAYQGKKVPDLLEFK
jgi:hypothetical protein